MIYIVYLKRSFRRCRIRHLRQAVILICSMIVPMIMSVYISGIINGNQLYIQEQTGGAAFHIEHASEADISCFEALSDYTAIYREHVIYLYPVNAPAAGSEEEHSRQISELQTYLISLNNNSLKLVDYSGFGVDEGFVAYINTLQTIDALLTAVGIIICTASYTSYLRAFAEDIRILRASGADRHQISLLFVIAFTVISAVSGFAAAAVSYVSARILYALFIGIQIPVLSWNVFCFDIPRILLHILIFMLSGIGSVYILARAAAGRYCIVDIRHCRHSDKAATELSHIFGKITGHSLYGNAALTMLILVLINAAANIASADISEARKAPQFEILLSCDDYGDSLLTEEEISQILSMPEIYSYIPIPSDSGQGTGQILLKLSNPEDSPRVCAYLSEEYLTERGCITDYYSAYIAEMKTSEGLILMYTLMLTMFVVCLGIITAVKTKEYMTSHLYDIRILHRTGAEYKTIRAAFMHRIRFVFLAACTCSVFIGLAVPGLFSYGTEYKSVPTPASIAIQALTILLIYPAWHLPVYSSVKETEEGSSNELCA